MTSAAQAKRSERSKRTGANLRGAAAKALDLDVLNGHLGYFIRQLQVRLFKHFIGTFAPMLVRPAQYSTMVLISANPGSSQAAIARVLHIERARFARLLNELEAREWIRRVAAAHDGRSHSLFMTSKGKKALAKLKVLGARHELQIADLLGARERETLIELLADRSHRKSPG